MPPAVKNMTLSASNNAKNSKTTSKTTAKTKQEKNN